MENIVSISGLNKWYGTFHVLKDIDLAVKPKERIVIAGPSGSGKSTLIRCINRLEEHQRGKIVVDGVELTNNLEQIEAIRREVGMVFQHFNLFPHLWPWRDPGGAGGRGQPHRDRRSGHRQLQERSAR